MADSTDAAKRQYVVCGAMVIATNLLPHVARESEGGVLLRVPAILAHMAYVNLDARVVLGRNQSVGDRAATIIVSEPPVQICLEGIRN